MESIYYVATFLCHRTCVHCYEDRFRPYQGAELQGVLEESRSNFARIIGNFPDTMLFRDRQDGLRQKRGRIILAGGEILLPQVRETVLYPALDLLYEKYRNRGGVQLIVQTTGDTLTRKMTEELLDHHVQVISVSGIDSFHAGLEDEAVRARMTARLRSIFEDFGLREYTTAPDRKRGHGNVEQRYYSFWGANPGSWIGKLWPRARAHSNGLSTAGIQDNFCAGWSGGAKFLDYGYDGCEVSVEPNGNVYPCCMKTQLAIGNLREQKLESIIARYKDNPVYRAINAGEPQRMGIEHGWSEQKFIEKSRTVLASGRIYENLCVGCDAFHREVLSTIQIGAAK
jgi:sulfatase maturation enzyme AslB (radical SAM superfamily)